MPAWDHWYHCTAHTYGTWLRGDPRGWRARHHREHVEGDYKRPPAPGRDARQFDRSQSLMKRDTVKIDDQELIEFVLLAAIERLLQRNIPTRAACFDGIHLHLLIQCLNNDPKIEVGIAKQYATAQLKAHGYAVGLHLKQGEGIWAKGSHPTPIKGEGHLHHTTTYIFDHINQGAIIWRPSSMEPSIEPAAPSNPLADFDPDSLRIDQARIPDSIPIPSKPTAPPWDVFRVRSHGKAVGFKAKNPASQHHDPQPDQQPSTDQDPKRRQHARGVAAQLFHHPHADVPRAEDEEQGTVRPPSSSAPAATSQSSATTTPATPMMMGNGAR